VAAEADVRDRTGQVWEFDGGGALLILERAQEINGWLKHPCLNLERGRFDVLYESMSDQLESNPIDFVRLL